MSRIIKNSDCVLTGSRIIEPLEEDLVNTKIEETPCLESVVDFCEKDELKELEEESQKIVAETEQLVMQLLDKAKSEAREIVGNAQEEADVLRNQVFEEARSLREQARDEGYQEGIKTAHEEMERDRHAAIEEGKALLEEAHLTRMKVLQSAEKQIVDLAVSIARKIVIRELSTSPDLILEVVRLAIAKLDDPDKIRIQLNPEDIDMVLTALDIDKLNETGTDTTVNLKADRRIKRGGCVVDSSRGTVDAQVENRIKAVEEAVLEVANG